MKSRVLQVIYTYSDTLSFVSWSILLYLIVANLLQYLDNSK